MQKVERQNAVLEIVSNEAIESQGDIADRLRELGFQVTQASVSRDLDELGVRKVDGRYTMMPRSTFADDDLGGLRLENAGPNMIVGRCRSGLASAFTVKIDMAQFPQVVGTIAGDDTIFIAVRNADEQRLAADAINRLFDKGL